jgi:hypothetical protein
MTRFPPAVIAAAHRLPASHRIFGEAGSGRRHRDLSITNRMNNSCRISSDNGIRGAVSPISNFAQSPLGIHSYRRATTGSTRNPRRDGM